MQDEKKAPYAHLCPIPPYAQNQDWSRFRHVFFGYNGRLSMQIKDFNADEIDVVMQRVYRVEAHLTVALMELIVSFCVYSPVFCACCVVDLRMCRQ